SGAKLACLCSSDKVYASEGVDAAKALKAAGAGKIYFAGKPGELESALRQAGIDNFVFQGPDVIALLQSATGSGRP
ncbi:MAG TPA: methylmalonyl-CoA mutase, partial [Methyloceanibacter sp.]|nr:methylmalonyl-CoA mutase [Methyloceanibacter sp.]